MPLVMQPLQGELIDIYEKGKKGNASPQIVGMKTAKAYMNYCSGAMNAGGHPFTGMFGVSGLGSDLGNIYSGVQPTASLTANMMATAFDTCLNTLMTLFQTTIVTAPGLPALISGLTKVLSSPNPTTTLFCMDLSNHLHTYTLSAQVIGVTPDAPGVPFAGPLS